MEIMQGSLLGTDNDIKRRKGLAINVILKLKYIFDNKRIHTTMKLRVFNAYVASIYLYNSELWTITKTLKNNIDSFQRRILRTNVLNVRWPKTLSNEQVYERTKTEKWSLTIHKRRLRWFGHVARMSPSTPARQALHYGLQQYARRAGRPQLTWIKLMTDQLKSINLTWQEAFEKAQNRVQWREVCTTFINM